MVVSGFENSFHSLRRGAGFARAMDLRQRSDPPVKHNLCHRQECAPGVARGQVGRVPESQLGVHNQVPGCRGCVAHEHHDFTAFSAVSTAVTSCLCRCERAVGIETGGESGWQTLGPTGPQGFRRFGFDESVRPTAAPAESSHHSGKELRFPVCLCRT